MTDLSAEQDAKRPLKGSLSPEDRARLRALLAQYDAEVVGSYYPFKDACTSEVVRALLDVADERDRLKVAGAALRDFARHYDWCDYSRNSGYAYGDDIEALERDHPCDCGAAGAFDEAESLFPHTPDRTRRVLAWRASQKALRAAAEQAMEALQECCTLAYSYDPQDEPYLPTIDKSHNALAALDAALKAEGDRPAGFGVAPHPHGQSIAPSVSESDLKLARDYLGIPEHHINSVTMSVEVHRLAALLAEVRREERQKHGR